MRRREMLLGSVALVAGGVVGVREAVAKGRRVYTIPIVGARGVRSVFDYVERLAATLRECYRIGAERGLTQEYTNAVMRDLRDKFNLSWKDMPAALATLDVMPRWDDGAATVRYSDGAEAWFYADGDEFHVMGVRDNRKRGGC